MGNFLCFENADRGNPVERGPAPGCQQPISGVVVDPAERAKLLSLNLWNRVLHFQGDSEASADRDAAYFEEPSNSSRALSDYTRKILIIAQQDYCVDSSLEWVGSSCLNFLLFMEEIEKLEKGKRRIESFTTVVINQQQTSLLNEVHNFCHSINPNDHVYFFYAGHATTIRTMPSLVSVDNQAGNAASASILQIEDVLSYIFQRSPGLIILCLDCLHSINLNTRTVLERKVGLGDNYNIVGDKVCIIQPCAPHIFVPKVDELPLPVQMWQVPPDSSTPAAPGRPLSDSSVRPQALRVQTPRGQSVWSPRSTAFLSRRKRSSHGVLSECASTTESDSTNANAVKDIALQLALRRWDFASVFERTEDELGAGEDAFAAGEGSEGDEEEIFNANIDRMLEDMALTETPSSSSRRSLDSRLSQACQMFLNSYEHYTPAPSPSADPLFYDSSDDSMDFDCVHGNKSERDSIRFPSVSRPPFRPPFGSPHHITLPGVKSRLSHPQTLAADHVSQQCSSSARSSPTFRLSSPVARSPAFSARTDTTLNLLKDLEFRRFRLGFECRQPIRFQKEQRWFSPFSTLSATLLSAIRRQAVETETASVAALADQLLTEAEQLFPNLPSPYFSKNFEDYSLVSMSLP